MKVRILSIDAWGNGDGGWNWNQWFDKGIFDYTGRTTHRAIINWFREQTFISDYSKGRVTVDDDGYNYVIIDRSSREPLYAMCYGEFEGQEQEVAA